MKNTNSTCNPVFQCYACNYCCVYLYVEEIWTWIKPWATPSANLFFLIGIFNRLWKSAAVECLGEELVHHRRCLLVWKRSDMQILYILRVWYLQNHNLPKNGLTKTSQLMQIRLECQIPMIWCRFDIIVNITWASLYLSQCQGTIW